METLLFDLPVPGGCHDRGGRGLARKYVVAIVRINPPDQSVNSAQKEYLGRDIEGIIHSHAKSFSFKAEGSIRNQDANGC